MSVNDDETYLPSTVTPKLLSTGSIGFANVIPLPPAKSDLHYLKLAVTVFAPFIFTDTRFDVLLIAPLHEPKWYPTLAVALKLTDVPLSYQHPPEQSGLTLPPPGGFTDVVS